MSRLEIGKSITTPLTFEFHMISGEIRKIISKRLKAAPATIVAFLGKQLKGSPISSIFGAVPTYNRGWPTLRWLPTVRANAAFPWPSRCSAFYASPSYAPLCYFLIFLIFTIIIAIKGITITPFNPCISNKFTAVFTNTLLTDLPTRLLLLLVPRRNPTFVTMVFSISTRLLFAKNLLTSWSLTNIHGLILTA